MVYVPQSLRTEIYNKTKLVTYKTKLVTEKYCMVLIINHGKTSCRPAVEYSSVVWSPFMNTNLGESERFVTGDYGFKSRVVRIILGM